MVKHTQTIRQLLPTNSLSAFDHFVGLALKGYVTSLALPTSISSMYSTIDLVAFSQKGIYNNSCQIKTSH